MERPDADHIRAGKTFRHLAIKEEIGRGAFGTVYLARDTMLDRNIALKIVHPPSSNSTRSSTTILNEAKLIAGMRSPHVVLLYRIYELEGGAWAFEMEHVDGPTLREYIDIHGTPDAPHATRLLDDILLGLEAAHRVGVVHNDIKPENVLIDNDGTAKLTDFGLSLRLGEAQLRKSQEGEVRGTPLYMSPEAIGGTTSDPTSDLWSFGVLAHELLTGERPFRGDTLPTLFAAIRKGSPPPLPVSVPTTLQTLVRRCLSKEPDQRPPSPANARSLIDLSMSRSTTHEASKPLAPSLIGRDGEIEIAKSIIKGVTKEGGASLLVTGDMGSGKSAFVGEVARQAAHAGLRCLTAHAEDSGGLLKSLQAQLMPSPMELTTESGEGRIRDIDGLFDDTLRSQPALVTIEDIDTGDDDDLRLVLKIVRRASRDPLIVVLSSRTQDVRSSTISSPEIVERIVSEQCLRQIHLNAIPEYLIKQIVHARFGDRDFTPQAMHAIASESSGNPMLALDLAGRAEDDLASSGGQAERRAMARTDRFKAVALSELRRLEHDERELIELAAIDGTQIDAKSLAPILGRSLLGVLRSLHSIAEHGDLVRSTSTGFRFAHTAFRWAVYDVVAPALRLALHEQLGLALEDAPSESYSDFERRAFHSERSGNTDEAKKLYRVATRHAMYVQRPYTSIRLGKAGGLLDEMSAEEMVEEADVATTVASAFVDVGEPKKGVEILKRMRAAAQSVRSRRVENLCTIWLADFAYLAGTEPVPTDHELESASRAAGACREGGRGFYVLGLRAKRRGETERALAYAKLAIENLENAGVKTSLGPAYHELGTLSMTMGDLDGARRAYEIASTISRNRGAIPNALIAEFCIATLDFAAGDIGSALTETQRLSREFVYSGKTTTAAHASILMAEMLRADGRFEEAINTIQANVKTLRGLKSAEAPARLSLGQLKFCVGQTQVARSEMQSALELAIEIGASHVEISSNISLAILHQVLGDGDTAERYSCGATRSIIALKGLEGLESIIWQLIEAAYWRVQGLWTPSPQASTGNGIVLPALVNAYISALNAPRPAPGSARNTPGSWSSIVTSLVPMAWGPLKRERDYFCRALSSTIRSESLPHPVEEPIDHVWYGLMHSGNRESQRTSEQLAALSKQLSPSERPAFLSSWHSRLERRLG